jgi:nucleoside-diphosphate-sugar epimerase
VSGRVLLTGASGFIGRHAVEALLARGFEVHAVTRTRRPPGGRAVHAHSVDLLAPGAAVDIVGRVRPTHLLHLAWYVQPGAFWSAPDNLRWVAASLELVRAFREAGGARAVLAGTCAEYAWDHAPNAGPRRESTTPLEPATLYGRCKLALWQIVETYARQAGLSAAWGRVFLLYGPGEPPGRLVSSVAAALVRGEPARCSSGEQLRDLLHAADVADAFAALLTSGVTGAVNVASGVPVRLKDVVLELARRADADGLVQLGALSVPPNDPPVLTADVTRLRDEVGWAPARALGAGLDDTLRWWRAQSAAPVGAR